MSTVPNVSPVEVRVAPRRRRQSRLTYEERMEQARRRREQAARQKCPSCGKLMRSLRGNPGMKLTVSDGPALIVTEKADKSDPHYRLCDVLWPKEKRS